MRENKDFIKWKRNRLREKRINTEIITLISNQMYSASSFKYHLLSSLETAFLPFN